MPRFQMDKIQENTEYEIDIDWFGGYLEVYTLYQNGVYLKIWMENIQNIDSLHEKLYVRKKI